MINLNNKLSKQCGFTLIELMISVSIGIAMTGITLQIFVDNKQMARVIEANSRVQENGRFALEFLMKNIREAGYDDETCTPPLNDKIIEGTDSSTDNDDITIKKCISGSIKTIKYSIGTGDANANGIIDSDECTLSVLCVSSDGGSTQEELVEGIESMQILYGFDYHTVPADYDNTPNNIPDYYGPSVNSVSAMKKVITLKISLLVVSAETGITQNTQTYQFDHDGNGSVTDQKNDPDGDDEDAPSEMAEHDKKLRRVFNTTIQLRNRVL